jgi:hypothetical protein
MKRSKTVTEKQRAANVRNGKLGKGPKTQRGKENSRLNAFKDGFFARGIPEKDLPEFEEIRSAIIEQLEPATTLQWIHAELIARLSWRCRCALNLEATHVQRKISADGPGTFSAPETPTVMEAWYGAGLRATNAGIGFLTDVIERVRNEGYFPSDAEEGLRKAFGQDFLDKVLKWKETRMDEYHALVMMRDKAKMFGWEGQEPRESDAGEISRDPQQMVDMMAKVLELKRDQLIEFQHIRQHQENQRSNGAEEGEPSYRYVASAFKELMRAIEFYERLRSMKFVKTNPLSPL